MGITKKIIANNCFPRSFLPKKQCSSNEQKNYFQIMKIVQIHHLISFLDKFSNYDIVTINEICESQNKNNEIMLQIIFSV